MVFTFYPCRQDGSSIAFDVMDLADESTARAYALKVLGRHDSAVEVVIWAGEHRVGAVARENASAQLAAE